MPRPAPLPSLLVLGALAAPAGCTAGKGAVSSGGEPDGHADTDTDGAGDDTADSATPPAARVRLTELMYHPVLEDDYEDHHEFIELHNAGPGAADLAGWSFADGVDHALPDRTLAPGETLVVAGDRDALLALYPELDPERVVGDWTGSLANGGEHVELVDAAGETVDEVHYEDTAPWPVGADALGAQAAFLPEDALPLEDHRHRGRSLQRVSLDAETDDPGNWVASPLDGATPGDAADVRGAAPLTVVTALTWGGGASGPLPPDQPVLLEVDASGPLDGARLEWFVDDVTRLDEAPQALTLRDDGTSGDAVAGDGRWTTTLPAQPEGSILRLRVLGDAGRGDEVVSPREGDPGAWHGRFVGVPIDGETRPVRIFIAPDDWTSMWDDAAGGRVEDCAENPGWEARVPAVFVSGGAVWDVRVRYQGSRWNRLNGPTIPTWTAPGPERPSPLRALSWSLQFPRYAPMDGRAAVTLKKLTQACPGLTSVVGFQLFEAVGLPVPRLRYTRVFINGAYYDYALEIERPAEDMVDRWVAARAAADPDLPPEPGTPHLFKSGGCNCDEGPYGWGDERPLEPSCGWSALERYAATYERKTWDWESYEALQAMIEGLEAARGGSDAELRSFLDATFDVDLVLAYMAVMNWGVPFDDMFQNHFLVQRRSDGRWLMAPWDLDRDFGGWKGASASIYMGEEGDPDNRSAWWNRIKDAFFRVYRDEYDATLFALNESTLHPDAVVPRVDAAESSWVLSEVAATPAGPYCDFTAGAEAFRQYARDRHAVVAAIAAGR